MRMKDSKAWEMRDIPAIERVLRHPDIVRLCDTYRRDMIKRIVCLEIDCIRDSICERQSLSAHERQQNGSCGSQKNAEALTLIDCVVRSVVKRVERLSTGMFPRVLNGTGIVLHTNLGRAPLGRAVLSEALESLSGYVPVEYDLETGRRTERSRAFVQLLSVLTGAESALVVNNNAAAVLLALSALSAGKEVPVSRGELVEIGGGFRIPEVIGYGGALLRETGTTNRTALSDYERVLTEETGAVLKVHKSNFIMRGFTEETPLSELVSLCHARHIPLIYDLGSGRLLDEPGEGGLFCGKDPGEPDVQSAVRQGVDIVCFSGDKLLGGPQAGIIVGKKCYVDRLRRHPLYRALRSDKVTLFLLERCIRRYLYNTVDNCTRHMLNCPTEMLHARAVRIVEKLRAYEPDPHRETESDDRRYMCVVSAEPACAYAGGGTLPEITWDSWAIVLTPQRTSAERAAAYLRRAAVPIIGRVEAERIYIDLMAIDEKDDDLLVRQLGAIYIRDCTGADDGDKRQSSSLRFREGSE